MSKLKVTFDSDANAKAFADKWKLSTPEGDSLDLEWHLAEDAIKDTSCSLEQKDEDEHDSVVLRSLYRYVFESFNSGVQK